MQKLIDELVAFGCFLQGGGELVIAFQPVLLLASAAPSRRVEHFALPPSTDHTRICKLFNCVRGSSCSDGGKKLLQGLHRRGPWTVRGPNSDATARGPFTQANFSQGCQASQATRWLHRRLVALPCAQAPVEKRRRLHTPIMTPGWIRNLGNRGQSQSASLDNGFVCALTVLSRTLSTHGTRAFLTNEGCHRLLATSPEPQALRRLA
jgi:hypothetical protein